ncbi:uncharacterized protein LOC135103597 [Scylla paramamosain]|uniref:uncharacterized protein LOC135103597 n=1 Tax=Scylla paramamosain TaxID=85552 RepID=UPI003083694F
MNLPPDCRGITSSIRFAGSPDEVNKNTITFYDSSAFTGGELMTSVDVPNLGYMEGKISSLIVTGPTPWTIYSERNFHGDSLCVASFEHDVGPNGQILDVGIFPTVSDIGIVDNSIKSARSGCHSKSKAKVPSLKADIRMASGASGTLM